MPRVGRAHREDRGAPGGSGLTGRVRAHRGLQRSPQRATPPGPGKLSPPAPPAPESPGSPGLVPLPRPAIHRPPQRDSPTGRGARRGPAPAARAAAARPGKFRFSAEPSFVSGMSPPPPPGQSRCPQRLRSAPNPELQQNPSFGVPGGGWVETYQTPPGCGKCPSGRN